jgi:SAM-dependent methyltransferase
MAQAGWSRGNLRFYLEYLFDGVDFRGRRVLDVGAGDGKFSFYAACMGATEVVGLEPEAQGSSAGASSAFEETASLLGLENIELVPTRLEDYDPKANAFDVLLLHASINHLDEDACIRLREDARAHAVYREMFDRLAALARPGADLIAQDCSPHNLFAALRVRNPFEPTIEWHKHQRPELWAELLGEVGFENPRIRWNSFNSLRSFGRQVIGNRVASFLLTSAFVLTMQRIRS